MEVNNHVEGKDLKVKREITTKIEWIGTKKMLNAQHVGKQERYT